MCHLNTNTILCGAFIYCVFESLSGNPIFFAGQWLCKGFGVLYKWLAEVRRPLVKLWTLIRFLWEVQSVL